MEREKINKEMANLKRLNFSQDVQKIKTPKYSI